MTDAIFGFATGNKFCNDPGFWVYVNSLCACGFKGDKILFTAEMPLEIRASLVKKGFTIVDVPKEDLLVLYRDRHYYYYNWNLSHKYRYILTTDTRDTVFYRNPISWIENTSRKASLFLVAEGFNHDVSWINTHNQESYQKQLIGYQRDFKNWQVVNGGTAIGTAERMKHFDLAILLSGLMCRDGDQCATNYVYRLLEKDPTVQLLHPENSSYCITGEGMHINKYKPLPLYKYHLFHQWDRTRYKDEILERYGKNL